MKKSSLIASFHVSLIIARELKTSYDGSFAKKCAIAIANAFENTTAIKQIESVSLPRSTVSRRISVLNNFVERKIKQEIDDCRYFSICLDESVDRSDTSQLLIYIRYVNDNFAVSEELLDLKPLYRTTKGIDDFNAVQNSNKKFGDFKKCSDVITDGAKAMVGS